LIFYSKMEQDIIDDYRQRASLAQNEADIYKKRSNTYSLLRLGLFILFALAVYFAATHDNFTIIAIATIILLVGFALLVSRQSEFDRQFKYFQDLALVNQNEIESITSYTNLYDNGLRYSSEKHYYSSDLDIFGNASLFQFINRCATTPGNNKLASWLIAPVKKDAILLRQDTVKELAQKKDWRLSIQARLIFAKTQDINQLQRLFSYLKLPLNMPGENWLGKYAKAAPYLLLVIIILAFFFPVAKSIAVLLAFVNLGVVASRGFYIKKTDLIAGKIGNTLTQYAIVFEKIQQGKWQSAYGNELAQKLIKDNTSGRIKELGELINKLNYHLNLIVGALLNMIFLWDIRQIIAIEQWKRDNHANMEVGFDVIADFEALMSLASLASNYPEWCIPTITDGDGYTVTAKNIAHPLINGKNRVVNDYELNNAFKVDIITGSNMAGKSTFLRTIGINTVLALSGAPVCADSMQVSVITLISYMRIKDSLNESTSTFKAELDRLQMLLAAVENEPKVFFLIDEMLRGTNSVDKYLGSKAVIEQLISKKAVGMVATHDLQIAQLEQQYPDYVRNFYFDIQVINGEMLFDYKMKHGECKTFNASLLLKQIGININTD